MARRLWGGLRLLPYPLRRGLAALLAGAPAPVLDRALGWARPVFRRYGQEGDTADKLKKLAEVLRSRSPTGFYKQLVSRWKEPASLVIGGEEPATPLDLAAGGPGSNRLPQLHRFEQVMMFLDLITYLPGDILTKVDRASMAVSLETRIPFLDPSLIDFAWRLPRRQKMRQGKGKWLLRQLLLRFVPPPLVERPKTGFAIPLRKWLLGPLREWAGDLLSPDRLAREGFFVPELVQEHWQAHIRQERDWHAKLWPILSFQQWLETQNSSPRRPGSGREAELAGPSDLP
jgi:asparagine synthase (glutamine-hydrolysing)